MLNKITGVCAIFICLLAIPFAACGNDAGGGERDTGSAKARINMPDNFPTVAVKCYGQNGIYVTNTGESSPGGLAVVVKDPQCSS